MKKALLKISLILFAAVAFVACDTNNTENPTDNYKELNNVYLAINWGAYYNETTANFNLMFGSEMTTNDEGVFTSEGVYVSLDMVSALGMKPAAGEYTISDAKTAGTCVPGFMDNYEGYEFMSGSFIGVIDAEGNETLVKIVEGTFTLTASEDNYTIKGTFTGDDNNTYKVSFSGEILFLDFSGSGDGDDSKYDGEDETATTKNLTPTSASATNYGNYYNETTDNIFLSLAINDSTELDLDLLSDLNSSELKVGTYTINDTYMAFTAADGFYDGEYVVGSFLGVINSEDFISAIWYLTSGTISVAKEGDNYTINVDAASAKGSKIKASYTGTVSYDAFSGAPSKMKASFKSKTNKLYSKAIKAKMVR